MNHPSIDVHPGEGIKPELIEMALDAGFCRARILAPFQPSVQTESRYAGDAPSAILVTLTYGNDDPDRRDPTSPGIPSPVGGLLQPGAAPQARLDLFSRRNYYAEAVKRLKTLSLRARTAWGGSKSDYRILCNSPVPEKPLALACELGCMGRNSLIMTPEAGSLVVIAAMTLPFALPTDTALDTQSSAVCHACGTCSACVDACPVAALDGDGNLDRSRCLQWYASRPGDIPPEIAARWGDRLYGCSVCRDVCPMNQKRIEGVACSIGQLPESFDAADLVAASDDQLRALFKGSALGLSWFGPQAIRRNAALVLDSRTPSSGNGK